MKRIIFITLLGITLIGVIGISLIFANLLTLNREIEKTLLAEKSLIVRAELFERFQALSERDDNKKRKEILADLRFKLSICNRCHHREDILSEITTVRDGIENSLSHNKEISPDTLLVFKNFITYSYEKAKSLLEARSQSLQSSLYYVRRYTVLTAGMAFMSLLFFSLYILKKGTSLEREIKEKEKVITDWALEWQNTFDTIEEIVIILDRDGKPSLFNKAATEVFGPSLLGKDLLKLLNLSISEMDQPARTLHLREKVYSIRTYPYRGRDRCIVVLREITKEIDLQKRLNMAERLVSLGIMAGGIAHEVNNALSPIKGYGEILYYKEVDREKKEYIEHILSSARRIEEIVRDILLFAKKHNLNRSTINIEEFIDHLIKTLEGIIPLGDIRILKDLRYTGPVGIDRSLFEIALLNILKNAVQAINESGKGDTVTMKTEKENSHIRIEVSDNGPGIPEEIIPYLFDPFFSTKEIGKGTGLGLSIAYKIIKSHGGDINVRSDPNRTTFSITIPEKESSDT